MSLTPTTPTGLQSGIPPLIALTMEAFMNMHLPERGFLLHPVIPAQGIVILFAPRGIGKTFTALSAALAVAGGATLFHWRNGGSHSKSLHHHAGHAEPSHARPFYPRRAIRTGTLSGQCEAPRTGQSLHPLSIGQGKRGSVMAAHPELAS